MTIETYVPLSLPESDPPKRQIIPQAGRRFFQCRLCGSWVDSTDLRQVKAHGDEPPADRASARIAALANSF